MKQIKINLGRELKEIAIIPLADVHFGDANCNIERVKEVVKVAQENPNIFLVLNGDLINNATKNSVSNVYGDTLRPMEQLEAIYELLKPVKDKILCVTNGNHEYRTSKDDDIDLTKVLCRELGIEDRYGDTSCFLFIRFGEAKNGHKETKNKNNIRQMCYTMFVTHGCGGGSTSGAKVNRLEHLNGIVDADIYIHSHTHLPVVFKQGFFRTDKQNSTVSLVDKLFVNTTSYLNYGGYGERFNFKPNSISDIIITLDGTKKNFNATIC